jgi:micrococcal nuclease
MGLTLVALDLGFSFQTKRWVRLPRGISIPDDRWVTVDVEGHWRHGRSAGLMAPIITDVADEDMRTFRYHAEVHRIYDGDTITSATVMLGFGNSFESSFRLYGIDTPEIRSADKEAAIRARDRVMELVGDRRIIVQTVKDRTGKYGRYLATIYAGNRNVNKLLVEEGLAVEYEV